jgi:hypothetical protein
MILSKEFTRILRGSYDRVYDGEMELEKMKLNRLGEITKAYDSWVTYVEDIASKRSS